MMHTLDWTGCDLLHGFFHTKITLAAPSAVKRGLEKQLAITSHYTSHYMQMVGNQRYDQIQSVGLQNKITASLRLFK